MRLIFILVAGYNCSGLEQFDAYDPVSGLEAHNYYRERHNVAKLVWDEQLRQDAQVHCDRMARTGVFDHAEDLRELGEGENLYTLRGPNAQVALLVLNYTDAVKVSKFSLINELIVTA